MMINYLKLIRMKHWLKNALVFLPLFFSMNLLNTNLFINCLIAFFVFSFASSIVYILNDIKDIDKDKLHPEKKKRPLASGAISVRSAITVAIALVVAVCSLSAYLFVITNNIAVIIVPAIYVFLNILYSCGLKNIPIIDVVILVSGFLFRVMYGGAVINTEVSKFLYLMVIFGSFYLGFGKRRNEIIKNGKKSRSVLALYNKEFLDKNMYVSLGLALVSYTLWCVDATTINRIGNDYIFWTIPLVMVIFQLYSLNIEGDSHGDPIEVILHNKWLVLAITLYVLVLVCLFYII